MKTSPSFRRTLLSGLLFAIPLTMVGYFVYKIFSVVHAAINTLAQQVGIDLFVGRFGLILLVILTILVVFFFLGWLIQRASTIQILRDYLMNILVQLIPSMSYYKSFAEASLNIEDEKAWKGVILESENGLRPGFLVQQDAKWVTLFFPNVPQCNIGEVRLLPKRGLKYQELPLRLVVKCLQAYGTGFIDELDLTEDQLKQQR